MQITFLGTSSGVPTRSRNVSSVALRLPQRAEFWLFDCGEGTQHQLLRSELKSSQLRRIFITHLHGDHIFGLMGLLASCGLAGNVERVDIYGPTGLHEYLKACGKYSHTHFSFPVQVHTVTPGIIYEDEEFIVSCENLKHRVQSFGYRVVEKDRPGRFDVEKAKAMGIPSGPVYGRLKRGETVTLTDGRQIRGSELCGEPEIGRKFAYCTDTVYCEGAVALAQDADVVIHEATFSHQDAQLAFDRLHSTSTMAAQVALGAGAKQLILTHFSPRYAPGNDIQLNDLLQEARAIFPNTVLAYDFFTYEIPRRRAEELVQVGSR
ncbi:MULTISPECIES: ribonuclease Z [unclassified Coleofasciculus]|uniref:ribonuclease Z n=1 Tax=unclassified Coleofasciculus TaxID=2692782 RepID=UPI00187F1BC0|nr:MULTISPECIES: ribonuclease Z [unclassified Coleofasciculus]MBE9128581.1 ribonuclease Z [Coleofasciculus sp. LEGE 07081]MBE9147924.1 ribonuclease Z [Coleofasciculus sp. LEGE 07092]